MNRKLYHWKAQLQAEDGNVVERAISVYWDPTDEGAAEDVARTAAAEASVETGKKHVGLTAVLQESTVAA